MNNYQIVEDVDDEIIEGKHEEKMPDPSNKPPLRCILATMIGIVVVTGFSLSRLNSPPPADFDFYVMSMSFQPEFCYTKRKEHFPGCQHPVDFWKTNLTIHGLWPQYTDGTWPASCTTEPLNNRTLTPILDQMERYWPNVEALQPTAQHFWEFWQHEWSKHGTCSGLSQLDYFQAALNHFVPTPDIVGKNYGGVVDRDLLEQAYGDDVVLVCQAGRYLSEVRVCIGASSDKRPTLRMPCPNTVLIENSCSKGDIHIAAFQSATKLAI